MSACEKLFPAITERSFTAIISTCVSLYSMTLCFSRKILSKVLFDTGWSSKCDSLKQKKILCCIHHDELCEDSTSFQDMCYLTDFTDMVSNVFTSTEQSRSSIFGPF